MAGIPDEPKGQARIAEAALFGLCPHCGAKSLFAGWVRFADRCRVCGLDLTAFDVGDGPAAFLTMIVGGVIVALAVWLQLSTSPPWWVHVLLWLPLTVIGVVLGLRVAKAALLHSEFRNRAGEGRERK
jgi:uncharacterized protein (DUF983 family)